MYFFFFFEISGDTEQDACMRCCRRNLNSTCFPIMDDTGSPDPLKDGTPCYQGSCNKVSSENLALGMTKLSFI